MTSPATLDCNDDTAAFGLDTYLKHYYPDLDKSSDESLVNIFLLDSLHDIFNSVGVSGNRLIDIGAGPCVYQFISACTKFNEIVATDIDKDNQDAIQRWVNEDPGAFEWKSFVKYVCELEGHQNTADREKQMRKTIQNVTYCDFSKKYPVGSSDSPLYDCVLTGFCIECIINSQQQWVQYLKNASNLLKSGGWFVQLCMPADFYMIGDTRMSCFKVDEEFVLKALKEAGFMVVKSYLTKHTSTRSYMNYEFTMVVLARKL
ncbi:indolethylamine N-methyltransferase-like [Saccoglossus kowalevskii]|uniref:Indolethylamine N-methyltransferase-like n=1 Tax=Saccoglossus kowalevskii TaxID=10224 RepID=A0ABM0GM92_SACKO|nr:PREDICTED: indolethylamine N-methyltransferase-like [Saccoglossus kowalevskii]